MIGLGLSLTKQLGGGFSPRALFANGEQGAWFDPSDLSTLWQDSARTTPVTDYGDPVGAMDDKSGNGNHATQATSTARPTLRQDGALYYLDFDGVDDKLQTGTIDLTHTSQVTVVAAVSKASNPAGRGTVVNFVDNGLNTFVLEAPKAASTDTRWLYAGNVVGVAAAHTLALNTPVLYTGTANIGAPKIELRANGASAAVNFSSPGTGNFKSGPLGIGDYVNMPGRFFHGRIYGLLVIDRILTASEIAMVEAHMATRSGVTL